jgi:glutaredoxin-like protein
MEMNETDQIIMYGTTWCGDCRRCRLLLDQHGIPYQWVDIDQDEEAAKLVENMNRGYRSIPTIVWPDGSHLTEPSQDELAEKLGITL